MLQTCSLRGYYVQVCMVSMLSVNFPQSSSQLHMKKVPSKQISAASEPDPSTVTDLRQRILDTAADLFYREGARAVGVDLIVERAAVAKTSLYRYFRTKDDLVAAFLQREDAEFWQQWDETVQRHAPNPRAELDGLLKWIGERVARPGYRGCPQLNVAAEFSDPAHPARLVAAAHKTGAAQASGRNLPAPRSGEKGRVWRRSWRC